MTTDGDRSARTVSLMFRHSFGTVAALLVIPEGLEDSRDRSAGQIFIGRCPRQSQDVTGFVLSRKDTPRLAVIGAITGGK